MFKVLVRQIINFALDMKNINLLDSVLAFSAAPIHITSPLLWENTLFLKPYMLGCCVLSTFLRPEILNHIQAQRKRWVGEGQEYFT
jgi:hypothetical protein